MGPSVPTFSQSSLESLALQAGSSLSTSAKLSRAAPDLPNLRLQTAPSRPALSIFREVMHVSVSKRGPNLNLRRLYAEGGRFMRDALELWALLR